MCLRTSTLDQRIEAVRLTNDNGLTLDVEALVSAADETDVLVIGFDFMVERVVIDFRPTTEGTPSRCSNSRSR